MSFKTDFLFGILSSLLWLGIPIIFFKLIYLNVESIAGWSWKQTLLLVGVYTMIDGLMMTLLVQNMPALERDIREGLLDSVLLKPFDAQLFYLFRSIDITQITNFFFGLAVVIYACAGTKITLVNLGMFLLCFFMGCLLYYSIWFIWTISTFWFPSNFGRTDLFLSMVQIGRYPSTIYHGLGSILFLIIIPLGMIASPATLALLGKSSSKLNVSMFILSLFFVLLTRFLWKRGIKKYDGAGR